MNVLFIASEGTPFVKTGGLADVIGALPAALGKVGVNAAVMLPGYGDIPGDLKDEMHQVEELEIALTWRRQPCILKKMTWGGVKWYFLFNNYYFNREGIYGFYDEGERFAFFCKAALACLPYLDEQPDILHCHDWQTGLVSVYGKSHPEPHPFRGMPTVFTIHNLQYQGVFPAQILTDVLGLGYEHFSLDGLEFYGQVSYLKGGLVYSDILTTVSKTYAGEIQSPEFGGNMDGILRRRRKHLFGVLNGIDYETYNPLSDPHICVNYRSSLRKKAQNKKALQEHLGLPVDETVPLLAVVSRLVRQKVDILTRVLERLLALDVQLVVLGTGDHWYSGYFQHYAHQYRDRMAVRLLFHEDLARKIYAGSDIFLMPSLFEPCGLSQLIAMRYGSIPVVRETGGLKDTVSPYDPRRGEGNGFRFKGDDGRDFLAAVKEALDLYNHRESWAKIVKNAVGADFGWTKSAGEYKDIYRSLLDHNRGE